MHRKNVSQFFLFADQMVYIQGAAATPVELLRAMTDYGVRCDVRNVRLYHMHLEGAAPFAKPENASMLYTFVHIRNLLLLFLQYLNNNSHLPRCFVLHFFVPYSWLCTADFFLTLFCIIFYYIEHACM